MKGGRFAPPTAQHAVREARLCARNIVATIRGRPLEPFGFESLGTLASLGSRSAVADVMGVKLSGILAWMLWRMVYLAKFPGWDRKARILADWVMDVFLPRDITQVRIFRDASVRREHFEPGEIVFRQGDVGDRVYFVIDGEAEIEIDVAARPRLAHGRRDRRSRPREEYSANGHGPRRTALNMASVSRDTFHTLVAHFPGVRAAMEEIMHRHMDSHADATLQPTAGLADSHLPHESG